MGAKIKAIRDVTWTGGDRPHVRLIDGQLRRHPRLRDLHRLWDEKRGERSMPKWSDFDPVEMAPWLGNLHLVEVESDPGRFRYRIYGTNVARKIGCELTGCAVDERPDEVARILSEGYGHCVSSRAPVFRFHDYHLPGGAYPHHRLLLPLSDANMRVAMILVGDYPAEESEY